jgi:peptide/nickel transport system substrate-binding protein
MRRPDRRLAAAILLVVVLALAGCRTPGNNPSPTPSPPGSTPRPFTVLTTDPIRVADPAAMTDASSAVLAYNVFQRLMTADPGESALKPDAAEDCRFTVETTLTCTLKEDLRFHNGHPLTSSDVKFSIERASRLDVPGSSVPLLASLRRIETPDERTVRFLLSRVDTQFGLALASPAASIVDEEVYDTDRVREVKDSIVGSGPFAVAELTPGTLRLTGYEDYVGRTSARLDELVYRTVADSATIEDAMTKGTVDVVWRGLDAAAITRLQQQVEQSPEDQTDSGYSPTVLTGARVLQLQWSPESRARASKPLRTAIALALQGDRTSASLVPAGVGGSVPTFPQGGKATPKVTWKSRINLTLGYDPSVPGGRDLAVQIRTRLEDTGGLSVKLTPDEPGADLQLVDRKAWTATALAWLQPYLEAPLPEVASSVRTLETQFRATTDRQLADRELAERLLAALQRQSAVDLVVLPISQSDEYLYARAGVEVSLASFGPGWQLGLWGIGGG